jgi:predicted metal-binding protein
MTREPGDLPSGHKVSDRLAGVPGKEPDLERDSSFSAETADALSGQGDASPGVTVIVCASCRDETGSDAHPRAGAMLGEDTRRAASGEDIRIRTIECLGNCKRRLSAAILRDGCWSYVFGDLAATSGADLVAGAKLFATSTDGLIPWRGRPDCLKRGLVARIPPLDLLKD